MEESKEYIWKWFQPFGEEADRSTNSSKFEADVSPSHRPTGILIRRINTNHLFLVSTVVFSSTALGLGLSVYILHLLALYVPRQNYLLTSCKHSEEIFFTTYKGLNTSSNTVNFTFYQAWNSIILKERLTWPETVHSFDSTKATCQESKGSSLKKTVLIYNLKNQFIKI